MTRDFTVIGITSSHGWTDVGQEASVISDYLKSSAIDRMHMRKPMADYSYVKKLISLIPNELHDRIILHSHFNLAEEFNFGGLHLKESSRALAHKFIFFTRSCHSLKELQEWDIPYHYSFLSPIYNSISKKGYNSAFNISELDMENISGVNPVIALGGVVPEKFLEIFEAKFAGAALLGYLWSLEKNYKLKISEILEARTLLNTKTK